MNKTFLLALAAAVGANVAQMALAADNARVSIKLPAVVTTFKKGPGMADTRDFCTICHSPSYVYMQAPMSRDAWKAEVTKMQKAYGCPIPDSKIGSVVNYLVEQNGVKNTVVGQNSGK